MARFWHCAPVVTRLDPILLLGGALLFSGCAAVAPLPASVALLGVLWLVRKRCQRWVLALAVLAWGVGWGRALVELSAFEAARVSARAELGAEARCAVFGRIITSPEWLHGSLRYWVKAERLECDKKSLNSDRVLRLYGGPRGLGRGDRIEAIVQLGPLQIFRNIGASDPTPLAARKEATLVGGVLSVSVLEKGAGMAAFIDGLRSTVRERILATFSPAAEPLARALVLGENDLSAEDDAAFKASGLAHLLAVSGTHLVFAVVMLVRGLRALLVRIERIALRFDVARLSAFLGALLALLYADFAGGSGSATRAAWMLVAGFAARALGRKPRGQRILGVTMCVGAAFDGLIAFDISFLLSLAATVGLILWSTASTAEESSRATWRSWAVVRFVEGGSRATVSALLPCIPILALMSNQVSVLGIVGNLLAGPIGEMVALPVCLLHAASGSIPALEQGLAAVGSGALLAVSGIAKVTAAQSWMAIPLPYPTAWHRVVVVVAAVAWVVRVSGTPRRWPLIVASLAGLVVVEFATLAQASPQAQLRITSLDVGQGDAALVDLPDGRLMLIDGGGFVGSPVDPGKSVILPALRARRRSSIDVMVLSHPHPDHFLGLLSVAKEVPVREFWTTSEGEAHKGRAHEGESHNDAEREGAAQGGAASHEGAAAKRGPYMELLSLLRQRGTRVRYPPELCRAPIRAGVAEIRVLAPCPDFDSAKSANDNSIVLRFRYGARIALSVGDAEDAEETQLVQRFGKELKADWLKVGHHGSRTSSTAKFLAASDPDVAVVSTGVRNRFGHPHAEAVDRLRTSGAAILRTDERGSIVWETDGEKVEMWSFSSVSGAK